MARLRKSGDRVAVTGLSVRLPGANSVAEFWQNLVRGADCSGASAGAQLGLVSRCDGGGAATLDEIAPPPAPLLVSPLLASAASGAASSVVAAAGSQRQ